MRARLIPAIAVIVAALGVPAVAEAQRPLRFTEADVFIEINATDGDAGLQMSLGGRAWDRLRLIDPRGREALDIRGGGSLGRVGLTDFSFESDEPPFTRVPFRRFRERFPAGRYRFLGTAPDGRRIVASDRLTHRVPAAPTVLAPTPRATVDPAAFGVRWEPVTSSSTIRIVRYQVIVSPEGPGGGGSIEINLPPNATSATIPSGVLARDAEYAVEVIARASSHNQTITEVRFRTAP